MSKPAHRIKSAHALRPPLYIAHQLGQRRRADIDLSSVTSITSFFAPLVDADTFMAAEAGEWGWDVTWPMGVDMAADRLLSLALEQNGKAENARLREWMASNRMTLADAARALGMTSRTINAYGTGARPVPRYIALACKGWDAEYGGK